MKIRSFLGIMAAAALTASVSAQTVDVVTTNGLHEPHSVVVDDKNNYYITDSANNRVVKYVPDTGALINLAGFAGQEGTNNGTGVFARFFDPKGIVFARGGLVVADSGNHTLRLVSLTGTVTDLAGIPGVAGNTDGPAGSATFRFPVGLAVDRIGNIYIADSKNNAIRKLDPANNVTTVVAGQGLREPAAVTVATNGMIFIADTRNHAIKVFETNGTLRTFAGSTIGVAGSEDSLFTSEALFSNPSGLLWLDQPEAGLLVADTGNHTIRRIFFNKEVSQYSVETYAGIPGQAGLVNAVARLAKFNSPVGLAKDPNGYFAVVDLANNAVRIIQTQAPLPPIGNPRIGWVDFIEDQFTGAIISILRDVPPDTFNNDVTVAILAEVGTETYFTMGTTPPSQFDDNIPPPSKLTGASPPFYRNGMSPDEVFATVPSIVSTSIERGDITIKAISSADGRRASQVTTARFRFKTANSVISGDNPASFSLTNFTRNAEIWYTIDGTEPTNAAGNSIRYNGGRLSLDLGDQTNLVFKVRAFKTGFKPSETITKTFSRTNFVPNRISFGFEAGEASSDFVAAPGQTFYAPITLTVLPDQKLYSLQFNVTVTNVTGPPVVPGNFGFQSMLKEQLPGAPPRYRTIPPAMFESFVFDFTNFFRIYTPLLVTNFNINLLGVGWLERFGSNNLFNTINQDLVAFSQAHDTIFESKNQKVVVGGYSFRTPAAAPEGSTYQIKIDRPTATDDGISADIFIEAPTKGSLTNGAINAEKTVTIGARRYIVGDVAPFRWFNAGDFGDTNLFNNDVLQVFQSAIYNQNTPPAGSDLFDAMDSSDGASTTSTVTNVVVLTNDVSVINLLLRTNGQIFVTTLVTNTYFVTNDFLTNVIVVSTNVPNVPQLIPITVTNIIFTTNTIVINTSTNPLVPNFVTTNIVVTNLIAVESSITVTNPPGPVSLITNMVPVAYSIITTNQLITGVTALTDVLITTTNVYTGGDIPANGFLQEGFRTEVLTNTTIFTNIIRFSITGGENSILDNITLGDGLLNVDDVFVTLRRSLDPSVKWYARFWSNGVRTAVEVPNRYRGRPNTPAQELTLAADATDTRLPAVTFTASHTEIQPGRTVAVPIVAEVQGAFPLKVLMFNVNVQPLNNAPPLSQAITFAPADGLGQPVLVTSLGPENYAAAWLDHTKTGISGTDSIGTLNIAIPDGAPANAAYKIQFEHISSSPNGVALFPQTVNETVLTMAGSQVSSLSDGIPDAWRLRYFGSLSTTAAGATADADQDGLVNAEEYRAGTNPMSAQSALKLKVSAAAQGVRLRFPSVVNKNYVIESSSSIVAPDWSPVSGTIAGNGFEREIQDLSTQNGAKFYRVRLVD